MAEENAVGPAGEERFDIAARIDRLPRSRHMLGLVLRIASGGWFEFFELFMPGFISLWLIRSGIFTLRSDGLFDPRGFASFLAAFFAGMFVSTIGLGTLSDRLGRRVVFVWSLLLYSAAQLAVGVLSDPVLIDGARFVAGLGVGMQMLNSDSFIAELVPSSARGHYMGIAFVLVLTAVPAAAFLSALLVPSRPFGVDGWRIVVLFGALGGGLVWVLQRGLPESPLWLETRGRHEEADRIAVELERRAIREGGFLPPPSRSAAPLRRSADRPWREMFSPAYRARTAILSVFQFCQTIAVFGFTAFVPILLVRKGFAIVDSLGYSTMIVLLTPAGGVLGMMLAERVERRWQLVSAAIMILFAGFGFAVASGTPTILFSGALVTLGLNWMITTFHPYAAELFPTRFRAAAIGFTASWSRVSAVFVGSWVSGLLDAFGTLAVFCLIAAAMLAIILGIGIFGPSTNGRSLDELSP